MTTVIHLLNTLLCRATNTHGIACRGRADHNPHVGRWHTRF